MQDVRNNYSTRNRIRPGRHDRAVTLMFVIVSFTMLITGAVLTVIGGRMFAADYFSRASDLFIVGVVLFVGSLIPAGISRPEFHCAWN